MLFEGNTPIVDAGIDFRPFKAGDRRFVLWPVLAWKVLVPEPRPRTLDVFQTAIIKLCGAGMSQADAIAERLALDRDLIAFILLQLQTMGLLDERGRPSPRAIKLVECDDEPDPTTSVGYVFFDVRGRRLWPRFLRGNLPYARGEIKGQGKGATLSRGDEGNPREEYAWVLWPSAVIDQSPPSAHAILKAARLHRRRMASFRMQIGDLGGAARAAPGGTTAGAEKMVRRVRFVSQSPQPVFVSTCIFVPKESREAWWQICDPFALGVSSELRAEVEQLVREGDAGLSKLVAALTTEALKVDSAELAELSREAAAQALSRVRAQMGPSLELLSAAVKRQLAAAQERLTDARVQFEGSRRDRAAGLKRIDEFLGIAYAALEEQFAELVSMFADLDVLAPLSRHPDRNRRLLERIARHLGFRLIDDAARAGLFAVTVGQVKGAISYRNRGLPGSLAAALLSAQAKAEHPLRHLARAYPDALALFGRLKRMRDDTSHHSEDESELRSAEESAIELYRALRALTTGDAKAANVGDAPAPSSVNIWTAELMARLRGQAARLVHECASEAEDNSDLRVRLVDLQQKALEIGHLRAGGAEPELMQSRLRDFAVAAALVIETGLLAVTNSTESIPPALGLPNDKRSLAALSARAARQLGFGILPDGQLPSELAYVRPDRVQRALAGHHETLAATVVALLHQATKDNDHPMRKVAAREPNLLQDIARITAARGHGDTTHLSADDVTVITDKTYQLARTFATLS